MTFPVDPAAPVPPDGEPHPFIPGSPGWLAYERGRAAADSWWRSRLESDETVEAAQVALRKAVGGYSEFGDRERAAAEDRRILRAVLAALLPVAEKPETDT